MRSPNRQLPPATGMLYTLNSTHIPLVSLGPIALEVDIRNAILNKDTALIRRLCTELPSLTNPEHLLATLTLEYAERKDVERCELVLKHANVLRNYTLLSFWTSLLNDRPDALEWLGTHDALARYIYLPMPCPDRDWCIEHKADRTNPGLQFNTWWRCTHNAAWQQAIEAHFRVEWERRFIGQPKLYYLLNNPTKEQTVFVATRPEPVFDGVRLEYHFPGFEKLLNALNQVWGDDHNERRTALLDFFAQEESPSDFYMMPS